MKSLAIFALLALALSTHAAPPSIDAIRKSLSADPQLEITGEQVLLDFNKPDRAKQHETFTLRFDRPTERLRLSYRRFERDGQDTQIEAWGTRKCLNILHVKPLLGDVTRRDCVGLGHLHGELREGSAVGAALNWVVEGRFLADSRTPNDKIAVVSDAGRPLVTLTSAEGVTYVRVWLDTDGRSVSHLKLGEPPGFKRGKWTTRTPKFTAGDFEYVPSVEHAVLADTKYPLDAASQAKLKALAAKGSRLAEVRMLAPSLGALMMLGYGDPSFDVEKTWTDLDRLGELGFGMAIGGQGAWLARAEPKLLPARFRNLSRQQRIDRGKALMWKGASMCDKGTIETLQNGYSDMPSGMQSDDIFEPNMLKLAELQRVSKQCDEKSDGLELRQVAKVFADPWPR